MIKDYRESNAFQKRDAASSVPSEQVLDGVIK
jgi:hypothetical protein